MKVKELRAVLASMADLQHHLGHEASSKALLQLGDVLSVRDREEVARVVENVQQRRSSRRAS